MNEKEELVEKLNSAYRTTWEIPRFEKEEKSPNKIIVRMISMQEAVELKEYIQRWLNNKELEKQRAKELYICDLEQQLKKLL